MEPVRGHRNSRVVEAARLHRASTRRSEGATLIEGPLLLEEALAAGIRPTVVFGRGIDMETIARCRDSGIDFLPVDDRALQRVAGTKTPRGPVAVIPIPSVGHDPGSRHLLVACGVGDPGNMGTLIRTAAAFGWDFGHGPGSSDIWSPKVLRAAAGGHFRVGLYEVDGPDQLRSAGFATVATVVAGGVDPRSLGEAKYAVLIGEESHGLSAETIAGCAHRVSIPMPGGTESLNASVAGAIVMYSLSG